MKRIAIVLATVTMLVGGEAWGQSMQCTDAGVTGFTWATGDAKVTSFNGITFNVRMDGPNRRLIKFSVYPRPVPYKCFSPDRDPSLSMCTSELAPAVEPIIFRGVRFERTVNWSNYVGGQSIGLAVAYGTCAAQ